MTKVEQMTKHYNELKKTCSITSIEFIKKYHNIIGMSDFNKFIEVINGLPSLKGELEQMYEDVQA